MNSQELRQRAEKYEVMSNQYINAALETNNLSLRYKYFAKARTCDNIYKNLYKLADMLSKEE